MDADGNGRLEGAELAVAVKHAVPEGFRARLDQMSPDELEATALRFATHNRPYIEVAEFTNFCKSADTHTHP